MVMMTGKVLRDGLYNCEMDWLQRAGGRITVGIPMKCRI